MSADDVGLLMARDGQAALIETRGRRTGEHVAVAVGFIEAADGSLAVAAGEPDADWALNLEADRWCRVTVGSRTWDAHAEELSSGEAAAVVRELILRYGTPAERLGRGRAFRLVPASGRDGQMT